MFDGSIVTIGKTEALSHTFAPKVTPKSGNPLENIWLYFQHASENFKVGIWDCTAGSWEHNHPALEFCYILQGSVKIIEKDGPAHAFKEGDSFVVPKGTPVTWVVEDYVKKVFVAVVNIENE